MLSHNVYKKNEKNFKKSITLKKALLYGEFIPQSTTGIAYVNSLLAKSLKKSGYKVTKIIEPRSKDYKKNQGIIRKKTNIKEFLILILFTLKQKYNDVSFITLSLGNLGLLKTLIIQFILKIKSKKNYVYIHRGDLNIHYKKSFYKKNIISYILKNSFKIIFLSKILKKQNSIESIKEKILIIPNALDKNDCNLADYLFKENIKKTHKHKAINFLFCGNLQKQKGLNNLLKAVENINCRNYKYQIHLDMYGMVFENIPFTNKYINYKGKLSYLERLKIMSYYDCLILPSFNEGLPLVLIECLSIGIPFITTKVGAIEDLLIKNYPYVCETDMKSVENMIEIFANDKINNKEILKKIIVKNNKLFKNNFSYKNFEKNIKKYIY